MQTTGATKNYKFGQKNNWRRTVWNEIVRRLKEAGTHPRDALVLYLAGEQDLDRKKAVSLGFNPNNMLIVERGKAVADKLRKEGKTVIHADLMSTLLAWGNEGLGIDVLYADLCSGFEPDTLALHDVIFEKPAFIDSVVMLNLLRGRDPRTNDIRAVMEKYNTGLPAKLCSKHRGQQYIFAASLEVALLGTAVMKNPFLIFCGNSGGRFQMRPPAPGREELIFWRIFGGHRAAFFSYRSGGLVLDSCVFQSPMQIIERIRGKRMEHLKHRNWRIDDKVGRAGRQIAQAFSIRTQRMSGQLPMSPGA